MNIQLPNKIEKYLKKMFNKKDLTEIATKVILDWAENQIRLDVSSKSIDEIINEDK